MVFYYVILLSSATSNSQQSRCLRPGSPPPPPPPSSSALPPALHCQHSAGGSNPPQPQHFVTAEFDFLLFPSTATLICLMAPRSSSKDRPLAQMSADRLLGRHGGCEGDEREEGSTQGRGGAVAHSAPGAPAGCHILL